MIRENDFIKRELQRLQVLLNKLIGLIVNAADIDENLKNQLDKNFNKNFEIGFYDLLKMSDSDFRIQVNRWDETHLDQLSELLITLYQKDKSQHYLKEKALLILDYLELNSPVYSFQRLQWRNQLQ